MSVMLFIAACSKKDDVSPLSSIKGNIIPIGSIASVTATSSTNSFSAVVDATTGRYTIESLPAGTYTLSFTLAPEYKETHEVPGPAQLTTETAKVSSAGTTTVIPRFLHGTVTWSVDGVSYQTTSFAAGGALYDSGPTGMRIFEFKTEAQLGPTADALYLYLRFTEPGTYLLAGSPSFGTSGIAGWHSSGIYYQTLPANSGTYASHSGTCQIIEYNSVSHTITGTFSFTAYQDYNITSPSKSVIGNFRITYASAQ